MASDIAKKIWQEIKAVIFATDKVAHMGVCFAITTLVAAIFHNDEWGIMYGAAVAAVIGLGKEFYDMIKRHGGFDGEDLWADFAGIMAACLTYGITLIGG